MVNFPDQQIKETVLRLCEDLASPVALKVAAMLRYGDYDGLAACRVDPKAYVCADSYWRDASATALLRKMKELPTTHDREAVARKNFVLCEHECLRTNQRLFPYLSPRTYEDNDPGVIAFIGRARKIMRDLLGKVPDFVDGRFGPGATYGDKGRLTTVPDKMTSRPTLTPDACLFQLLWDKTLWARACLNSGQRVSFVQGNRFTTVPKDCEKDRGIAIEPSINVFYQLGVGRHLKKRLKLAGIDLQHGQDIHRRVAREASIKGHLATLDLSNASDTVSRNLVKLLLPPDWFEVLDTLRAKKTEVDGKWHVLEKFSSMGNGFTFELETLIFLCLVLACERDENTLFAGVNVFVFGDDIICPTENSRDVISVLKFFGMTVNERKSFVDGPFRESCGGDYFMGVDVRPHFMEELPVEPQQLISLANGLRRACKGDEDRFNRVRRAWFSVLDALPKEVRELRGPEGLGDLVVHDEERRWRPRWRSNGVRYFRVYRPARYRKVAWHHWKPDVILAAAIYGTPSGAENRIVNPGHRRPWSDAAVMPRDPVTGYKVGWAAYS